jgi:hypothetical protein
MAVVRRTKPKFIKKKTVAPRRPRTGLAAAPVDKGFMHFKDYFNLDLDRKESVKLIKAYVKANCSKSDAAAILACPEYVFNVRIHIAACMHWSNLGLEFEKRIINRSVLQSDGSLKIVEVESFYDGHEAIRRFIEETTKTGKEILLAKNEDTSAKSNVVVLTPLQRYQAKLNDTILTDLDELEDLWIGGEEPDFDLYNRFRYHGLTGKAAEPVRKILEGWLLDFNDAYHKRCDQAVEGYSHIKRSVMRRRIKHVELMLADCDKLKAASAATRKVRKPRVKSADKQVVKMRYKKEDKDFKIVSINPISIVGAMRLYVFNAKTREITEYVSGSTSGFSVRGTTLQAVDLENSRKIRLRKPDDFLPIVQSKTIKQIDNAWKKLTTKESKPNGRINDDCILIKVQDK